MEEIDSTWPCAHTAIDSKAITHFRWAMWDKEQRSGDKARRGKAAASSHLNSELSFSENCKILKSAMGTEFDEAVSKHDQQVQISEKGMS